jgi:hypothetical protein
MELRLNLSRAEIRALDSIIQQGRPFDEDQTPEQRLVLSMWHNATFDTLAPTRLESLPRRSRDELEKWFDTNTRKW